MHRDSHVAELLCFMLPIHDHVHAFRKQQISSNMGRGSVTHYQNLSFVSSMEIWQGQLSSNISVTAVFKYLNERHGEMEFEEMT